MASSRAALRRKKVGVAMQLPPHVQTNINKEDRLLQQSLEDLEKKARHRVSCIIRDQQVAGMKLRSLQIRLLASQNRSYSMQQQSCNREKSTTTFTNFYKSLIVPGVSKDTYSNPSLNGGGEYYHGSSSRKGATVAGGNDEASTTGSGLKMGAADGKSKSGKSVSFSK